MDLIKQTKKICELYDIKPSRSKGQNFLVTESVYKKLVKEAELEKRDNVLEVGPGLGFLTSGLAREAEKVVSVELDDSLAQVLQTGLDTYDVDNVRVVNKNILDLDLPPEEFGGLYKVVANLPYNITSVFLRKVLSAPRKPELMVLLLQKEVAERIVANPPKMSLLALSVQYYGEPEYVDKVVAGNFWPKPKVDSAIIKIKIKNKFPIPEEREKNFFRMLRIGFSSKRKMLKNNLGAGLKRETADFENILKDIDLNPKARAQDLSLEQWVKLFERLDKSML